MASILGLQITLQERYQSRRPRLSQPPMSVSRGVVDAEVAAEPEARSRILLPEVESTAPAEEKGAYPGAVNAPGAAAKAVTPRSQGGSRCARGGENSDLQI